MTKKEELDSIVKGYQEVTERWKQASEAADQSDERSRKLNEAMKKPGFSAIYEGKKEPMKKYDQIFNQLVKTTESLARRIEYKTEEVNEAWSKANEAIRSGESDEKRTRTKASALLREEELKELYKAAAEEYNEALQLAKEQFESEAKRYKFFNPLAIPEEVTRLFSFDIPLSDDQFEALREKYSNNINVLRYLDNKQGNNLTMSEVERGEARARSVFDLAGERYGRAFIQGASGENMRKSLESYTKVFQEGLHSIVYQPEDNDDA